ncbi:MAG TPA: alpha/beta hydrolase [Candidatus Saccharimonadales bacterium]|nr:alpha/beta hydrolase [Candidatus Saccharimonadales bacterium]
MFTDARVIVIPGAWQHPDDYETLVSHVEAADTGLWIEVLDLPSSRQESKEADDLAVLAKTIAKHEDSPAHLVAVSRGGALAVRASYEDSLSSSISGITLINVGGPPVVAQRHDWSPQKDSRHTPLFFEGIIDLQDGWTRYNPDIAKEVFYNCTPTALLAEIVQRMRPQRTPRGQEIPRTSVPIDIPVDVVCASDDKVYNEATARERRRIWLGRHPDNEESLEGDHSLHVSNPSGLADYIIRSVHAALVARNRSRLGRP